MNLREELDTPAEEPFLWFVAVFSLLLMIAIVITTLVVTAP